MPIKKVTEEVSFVGVDDTLFEWLKAQPCTAASFRKFRSISTEQDVADYVKTFIVDIIAALDLPVRITAELQIFSVRPDMWVILNADSTPIGAIEIKKPSSHVRADPVDIFNHPLVLGELYDQMKQIQQFCGFKFSIGILSDGNNFRVCWYGDDERMHKIMGEAATAHTTGDDPPTTPVKVRSAANAPDTPLSKWSCAR